MRIRQIAATFSLCAILFTGIANSATISLDAPPTRANGTARVAVNVSAASDIAGVNLRLEYDPAVFSSPSLVSDGNLLETSHVLASYSPEAGKYNVIAYAPAGAPPFSDRSGVAFTMTLQVASSVADGTYPIVFAATGTSVLAPSGLSDGNGSSMIHTALPGNVMIQSVISCDLDGDNQVSCCDLLLLMKDWHRTSMSPLLDADINGDTIVDGQDLMYYCNEWNPLPDPARK